MMNKKDLFITKSGDFLDKFTLKSSELQLLSTGDGVEIMRHTIDINVMFQVTPSSKDHILEFFHILNGEMEYQTVDSDEVFKLGSGDSFTAQNLSKNYVFKTLTKCELLYVSSEPVFHMMGEQMRGLHKLNAELEFKDSYTKGHSERVHNYAIEIAQEMGLNRDIVLGLAFAALFHDIGKIDVPTEILKKGDILDDEEYEVIKNHPLKSAELIKQVNYKDVSHIVSQHHEKLDGTGYPLGLVGDEICLESRIVAVADTFDAMTTDRPYRKGLPENLAVQEINNYANVWYDAEVVEAFTRYINKKNKLKG